MPRINEHGQEESSSLLEEGTQRVRRVAAGFIDFATQGNILEIAFGLMYVSVLYLS
jgi:large conductance mechanosensitive channel